MYWWLFLLRMTEMTSLQVVVLVTPEIHLVTSSTMTGTSTLSSLLADSWWLEVDSLVPGWDCSLVSSFRDRDLLLELLSFSLGGLGRVLVCLVACLWWW